MKPEERAQFILGQLNTGLRTEWSQIEGLEASLEKLLHEAKARADAHIAAASRPAWEAAWTAVHSKLSAIQKSAAEARQRLDAASAGSLDPWMNLMTHDRELDHLLDTLRIMGREALPGQELEPWYDGWKGLWVSVEENLSTLRAHIVATRFRLEMREQFGAEKADDVTRQILANLPADATLEEAERYASEYRVAHHEVVEHSEHPTLRDIIRGLLLLPDETPEERLREMRRKQAVKPAP
jgi:hypothetical protein